MHKFHSLIIPILGASIWNGLATTTPLDSNDVSDPTGDWLRYPVGDFILAAVKSHRQEGQDVWNNAIAECQTYVNGTVQNKGADCVSGIANAVILTALEARSAYTGAQPLRNEEQRKQKRHSANHFPWKKQNTAFAGKRADLGSVIGVPHGYSLLRVSDGAPDIDNSIELHMASKASSSRTLRHVTNGTHGYVRLQYQNLAAAKRSFPKLPNATFNANVAGFKLSYKRPVCTAAVDLSQPEFQSYRQDISTSIDNFVQTATGFNSFNVEIDNYKEKASYLLATLVAEKKGFGDDYEPVDFKPEYECSE